MSTDTHYLGLNSQGLESTTKAKESTFLPGVLLPRVMSPDAQDAHCCRTLSQFLPGKQFAQERGGRQWDCRFMFQIGVPSSYISEERLNFLSENQRSDVFVGTVRCVLAIRFSE